MKALVCVGIGSEDNLKLQNDWPEPECKANGIVVAVRAASVNFPDILIIRDEYQVKLQPPFVPGNECAGIVAQVGSEVSGVAVGDRVFGIIGMGAFAEKAALTPPMQWHRTPDEMPDDEAAALTLTYGTADLALERGQVGPHDKVLITGAAGGCGSAAVQIAKALGSTVIAVAGGPEKAAFCKSLGADHVIDHHTVEALAPVVKELTDGRGIDVICDNVGGPDIRDLLRCMAWNGRFLVVGFAGRSVPTIGLNQTILKSISVIGIAYGVSAMRDPAGNKVRFERLLDWYQVGKIRPHIGHRFNLEAGAEALRTLTNREAIGKVVILTDGM